MTLVDWTTPPTLRGKHVLLEPLAPAHAPGLKAAVEDGRLHELWYTSVPAPGEVEAYVTGALEKQATGTQLAFAVRDANGRVVGTTRFYEIDANVPRLQIGYTWYAKRVQRTGLNTEAKLLLLTYAFEILRCAAVGLQTSWFNQASRTAIARLGAKEEGMLRWLSGVLSSTVNIQLDCDGRDALL